MKIKKLSLEELKEKYNGDLDYSLEHTVERVKEKLKDENYEINTEAFVNNHINNFFRINYPESISKNKNRYITRKEYNKKLLSILYTEEKRRMDIHYSLHPNTEMVKINLLYNKIIRLDKLANGENIDIKGNEIYYNDKKIYQENNVYIDYENYIELLIYSFTNDKFIKVKIDKNRFDKVRNYTWGMNNDKHGRILITKTEIDHNVNYKYLNIYNLLYDKSEMIKFCTFNENINYIDFTLENIKKRFENEIINSNKYIYRGKGDGYTLQIINRKM